MGVHGLWELLAPVGRRVSVETLAGKTLAVDASIWMVQFVKAMRDEKGEMVRNAHLLGFFRRICKLLFLRTKPVFVFDGGTPALKRRTVIARRRQRENAQAKVRKTAEKLLLNHLKALRLKELADDVRNQRMTQNNNTPCQKKSRQKDFVVTDSEGSRVEELDEMSAANAVKEDRNSLQATISASFNQEKLDEMLAASIAAEESRILAGKGVPSTVINPSEEEYDADEEIVLPSVDAEVDMSVLAALPQSMQRDILAQLKGKKTEGLVKEVDNQKQHEVNDRGKGKGILLSENDMIGCSLRCDDVTSRSDNQNTIDEMLAASIAVEENEKLVNNASTSVGASSVEEEDGDYDEDEEMILPAMQGKVDPAVLASLPPSMQLDLLVQMRERLIAENRQKYQKVKKDPAKFSELQIQAYLKTVAFRREIDGVQKAAAGGGVGGVQTSRIASEANREYIFSSSFTGDKQELTTPRLEKNKDIQQKAQRTHPSQNIMNSVAASNDSNTSGRLVHNEPSEPVHESIQTYLDERGRFRVSRSRAMGMHMTRDIQRNLDLMKEIEQERADVNNAANIETVENTQNNAHPSETSGNQLAGKSLEVNVDLDGENVQNEQLLLGRDTSIDISFEYDVKNKFVNDGDDIFSSLVGGNPVAIFHGDDNAAVEEPTYSDSDCEWEEGIVEGRKAIFTEHDKVELKSPIADEDNNNEDEVEWEDGDCDGHKNTLLSGKLASRGWLEEESDLQEAIRRSLESTGDGKPKCTLSLDEQSNAFENKLDSGLEHGNNLHCSGSVNLNDNVGFLNNKNRMGCLTLCREESHKQNELHEIEDGDEKLDFIAGNNAPTTHFHLSQSKSSVEFDSNKTEIIDKLCSLERYACSEDSDSGANVTMKDEVPVIAEKLLDKDNEDGKVAFCCNNSSQVDSLGETEEKKRDYINKSEDLSNLTHNTKPAIVLMESFSKGSTGDLYTEPKLPSEDNSHNNGNFYKETNSRLGKYAMGDFPALATEVRLEEEMRILGQEYTNLENEQRKLERNAESVNSELFTECQELLQMFGLPYIIAPMEAEAQCAYLELAKLVDGVVTDDSDVFLFGARSVYKNIFDDRKYVETYFMEDIEKELGLSREKLIHMALLLGSDYTEGVSGIGIVNAIEVVNAFPEEDGLVKFRQWVESPDPTILGRLDAKSGSNPRKKGSKVEEKISSSNFNVKESAFDQNLPRALEEMESQDYAQEIKQTFFNKHRNVSKNWHIPSSFPSETVISAYNSPQVDKSTELFTWGKPDHLVLRKLCWEKFGWTGKKADELLLPVLKEYNKHETQLRLEAFYSFNERFAKIRSKRIKKAVKGITGKQLSDVIDDSAEELSKSMERRRTEERFEGRKKLKVKQSRKRSERNNFAKGQAKKKKINCDPSSAPSTSEVENRSRGGRGRGRGVRVRSGREKDLSSQSCEIEASSGCSDIDDHGARVQVDEVPKDVPRSKRSRKPVNYSFENREVEDDDDSFDQKKETGSLEEPTEENLSHIHGACEGGGTDFSMGEECSSMNFPLKEKLPRDHHELQGWFHTHAGEAGQPGTENCDTSDGYLKMGGGFCLDDNEMDNKHNAIDDANTASVNCTNYPGTNNCVTSDDYLEMGGGFCLDDNEIDSKDNTINDVNTASVDHTTKTVRDKNSSDAMVSGAEKTENEMQDGEASCKFNRESDGRVLIPENSNTNSGTSTGAFSAMPFLRKRRKKT